MFVFQVDNGNSNINLNVNVNGNGNVNAKGNQIGSSILIKAEDCNDPLRIDPCSQDVSVLSGESNSGCRQKTGKESFHDNEKKSENVDVTSGKSFVLLLFSLTFNSKVHLLVTIKFYLVF